MSSLTSLRRKLLRTWVKSRKAQITLDFNRLYSYLSGSTWRSMTWRGVPCVKFPTDVWVLQEILHRTRPEVIVECGVRYGGTTLFMADILELSGQGHIVGVDIDMSLVGDGVREHPRIALIEGSSTADDMLDRVRQACAGKRTMVILDSDHSYSHVARELELYHPLVSSGCYLVVEDTGITAWPITPDWPDRGPHGAVLDFLPRHPEFKIDPQCTRLLLTGHPDGFLLRE